MIGFVAIAAPELPPHSGGLEQLQAAAPRARWIHPGGRHITLKFLGNLTPEREDAVIARLTRIQGRGFEYLLEGLGVFPDRRRPRILWAGVGDPSGSLTRLAAAVEAALEPEGFAREPRPFHPHLTLARVREPRDLEGVRPWLDAAPPVWPPQRVDAFYLYRTRPPDRGHPDLNPYEPRRRFPLT